MGAYTKLNKKKQTNKRKEIKNSKGQNLESPQEWTTLIIIKKYPQANRWDNATKLTRHGKQAKKIEENKNKIIDGGLRISRCINVIIITVISTTRWKWLILLSKVKGSKEEETSQRQEK